MPREKSKKKKCKRGGKENYLKTNTQIEFVLGRLKMQKKKGIHVHEHQGINAIESQENFENNQKLIALIDPRIEPTVHPKFTRNNQETGRN